MKKLLLTTILLAGVSLSAQAEPSLTVDPTRSSVDSYDELEFSYDEGFSTDENDPLEPVNRAIFDFNQVVDKNFLKPVAEGYDWAMPKWGQKRVSNFLSNLSEPVNLVNNSLQANGEGALTSLWRFIINTTFGVFGTFDAATEVGLKPQPETFGQTLYVWGVDESPYLVLPILGPSTLRDTVGLGVDFAVNPFNYDHVLDTDERIAIAIARVVDTRTSLLPVTNSIDSTALDPYVAYRSSYLQNFAKRAEPTTK